MIDCSGFEKPVWYEWQDEWWHYTPSQIGVVVERKFIERDSEEMETTVMKSYTVASNNSQFIDALAKSIRHARLVARREHIKADRTEGVNQFLVSLRRELQLVSYDDKAFREYILDKSTWYDIGLLNAPSIKAATRYPGVGESDYDRLRRYLHASVWAEGSGSETVDEIMADLEALSHTVDFIGVCSSNAERINQESNELSHKLETTFPGIRSLS